MKQICKFLWIIFLISSVLVSTNVLSKEHTINSPIPFFADLVEADEAENSIFLIVHGSLAHKDMEIIQAFQDALLEQSYTSLAITLPLGTPHRRNFQDCNAIKSHTHQDAQISIGSALTWLHEKYPLKKVILTGHSRGGNQAVQHSRIHPDAVHAVVAVSPMVFSNQRQLPKKMSNDRYTLSRFLHCQDVSIDKVTVESYFQDNTQNTPALLLQKGPPVKVIFGDEDPLYEAFTNASSRIQLSADLEVIEGADHFFRDLYAEDAVDIMVTFAEGLK